MLTPPVSHYLLNTSHSREVDRRAQDELKLDSFTLMEVAGASAARIMLKDKKEFSHGLFLCGKGNNAGDALVVARYLEEYNIKATLVFLSGTNGLSADTQKNLTLLKKFSLPDKLTVFESWDELSPANFDFIVDGMLGTGLNSDVRGDYARTIEWVNRQNLPVLAMDIPTGLNADTGKIMGTAIHAEHTIAFGGQKQGFYLENGPDVTGTVAYCQLPFPPQFKSSCSTFLLDEEWIPHTLPKSGEHKYEKGVLYIIAGSSGLTGAGVLAAESAWAEGLGAVILVCPKGVLSVYENLLPFIIKKPVGSKNDVYFREEHVEDVLEVIQQKEGKLLLGPGLGRANSTVQFVKVLLSANRQDTVIDADGLWCLAQLPEWQKPKGTEWVLTPHPGELARLAGKGITSGNRRLELVRRFASDRQATILSKGMPGIIGTQNKKCYLTNYDTRYFARAGSGDVLVGKVSAYLAFGHPPELSCVRGLLNGKQKLDRLRKKNQRIIGPKDFI